MKRSKRQRRQMIAMCSVLAVCILTYVGLVIGNNIAAKREAQRAEAETIHLGSLQDVVSLDVTNENGDFYFRKNAQGRWYLENYQDVDLRSAALTYLVFDLLNTNAARAMPLEDAPESYGFTDESVTIFATDSLGNTLDLIVGKASGYKNYYMEKGGDTVYLCDNAIAKDSKFALLELVNGYSFHAMTEESVIDMRFVYGGHTYVIDREVGYDELGQVDYTFYVTVDGGRRVSFDDISYDETVVIDQEQSWSFRSGERCLSVFLAVIESFDTETCVYYAPDQAYLADHGLTVTTADAVMEMNFTYRNVDYHYVMYIGDKLEDDETMRYAWIEGTSLVETMSQQSFEYATKIFEVLPEGFPD